MANERSIDQRHYSSARGNAGSAIDRSAVHSRISHPVVSQYARDFAATGLSYAQIKGISDSELMERLPAVGQ